MNLLGHGIDLVHVPRLRQAIERQGEHFENRVFTSGEREYCRKHKDPFPHFAARFGAKEAYAKAIGLGIGGAGDLKEIEVDRSHGAAPELKLHGRALELFRSRGGVKIHLSLSHDGDMAAASVILLGD